jgi:hypothetical protein
VEFRFGRYEMGEFNRSWALDDLRDYLDVSTRPTRRDRLRRG